MPTPKKLTVATDGSCLKNPGGATGWAWVAENGDWRSGSLVTGTNQIGELQGLLNALRDFITVEDLTIQIDSQYALSIYTKWARGWKRNGWKKPDGSPVANLALVKALVQLESIRADGGLEPVRFEKVKGHDTGRRFPLNEAVDIRAGEAAKLALTGGVNRESSGSGARIALRRLGS